MELTPEMNMPMMVVSTVYVGASPEDIDELITKPIEEEVGQLSGISSVDSVSSENSSIVLLPVSYTHLDVYKRQVPAVEGRSL